MQETLVVTRVSLISAGETKSVASFIFNCFPFLMISLGRCAITANLLKTSMGFCDMYYVQLVRLLFFFYNLITPNHLHVFIYFKGILLQHSHLKIRNVKYFFGVFFKVFSNLMKILFSKKKHPLFLSLCFKKIIYSQNKKNTKKSHNIFKKIK